MLGENNQPMARDSASKQQAAKIVDEKLNIFSQAASSKKDLYGIETRKRGPLSSATSASTVAQSQIT